MKNRLIALLIAILLVTSVTITVHAASPRALAISPSLNFSGTTALCSAMIIPTGPNDNIDAVIKLWRGAICLKTWTPTGTGYIFFSEEYSVAKNYTYTLTVDVYVNDTYESSTSTTNTCK